MSRFDDFAYMREHFPIIDYLDLEKVKKIKSIYKKKQLIALAEKLKVRDDWHEPDEQDVSVRVIGYKFDNAHMDAHSGEVTVIIFQGKEPVAAVNLAILLAWATGYVDER